MPAYDVDALFQPVGGASTRDVPIFTDCHFAQSADDRHDTSYRKIQYDEGYEFQISYALHVGEPICRPLASWFPRFRR